MYAVVLIFACFDLLALLQLSRSIARYHQEKEMQQARTEKEDQLRLRKIASTIAKEIKHFWDSIQKVNVWHSCTTLIL